MERTEATPADARREIPVNEASIAKLVHGEFSMDEADVAWFFIRRCRNWSAAYDRALTEFQRDLLRRSMEG